MTTIEYYAEYSNNTAYGIKSYAVRYTWAGYYIFVIVSSLIGDTTILIASIKYKAFRLHRVIIVIIQHIAFCDLIVSATDILPKMVSLISEKVLGNFFCYLFSYARYYSNVTSVFLICAMTTSKLLLLKYPLQFGTTTLKKAHLICVACWLAAFTLPMTLLLVDKDDVFFSFRGYGCDYGFSSEIWHYLRPFMAVLFVFIPTCVVVLTTFWLLIEARKIVSRRRESLKWQGIVTTFLTATVYCLSLLPYLAYRVGESIVSVDDKSESSFHTTVYRVAISFVPLNTISNFYIYSLTVSSFRAFIRSKMQLSYQFITNVETSSSHGGRASGTASTEANTGNVNEGSQQTPV